MKQGQSGIQYNVEIFDIKIALILLYTLSVKLQLSEL